MNFDENKTIVVIGAGPVGISAAAHLISRGLTPIVLEKGISVGAAISQWGHVKLFSPWNYIVDTQVRVLLQKTDWQEPDKKGLPTGQEIVDQYLIPASLTPQLYQAISYEKEVIAVSKQGHAKSSSNGRNGVEYTVHIRSTDGTVEIIKAAAVIDASGTWSNPNPIGLDGLPVSGERENQDAIVYGIPYALGKDKADYAGNRVLVLGGGHSAINVALDLLKLQRSHSDTKVIWGLRTNKLEKLLGGGINDELPARGDLGIAAKKAIDAGLLDVHAPFEVKRITKVTTGLSIEAITDNGQTTFEVDRIIVTTGFRPDLNMLRELRLELDSIVEAPKVLAPLIDPNLHSCGSVPPHGFRELSHPDENFYIVGMKAYGRAPTFLMLTGYEQVRSVAAQLAGDHESANRVELILPKTGVCSTNKSNSGSGCCEIEPEEINSSCCIPKVPMPAALPLVDKAESACCVTKSTPIPSKTSCCG
ncbi:flavoprotein ['Osedax' symbiont bacterium Rs2_46_30_T18]|nr:flavoprotein ['Osedax' symbiont bacterium Rs2_46_30_T18]